MKWFQRDGLLLIAILGFALTLRTAAVVLQPENLTRDLDAYLGIAEQLAAGQGFASPGSAAPTAYRPPLYPLLLAALLKAGGGPLTLGVLQILLGTATVWLTFQLGRRLGLGRTALIAALIVAVDPLLVQYTTFVMTEVLFAFLVALLLFLAFLPNLERGELWRRIAVGFVFGLAALCRPTIWVFGGFAALWWIVRETSDWKWQSGLPQFLRRVPWLALVAACATVAPWLLRNLMVFGEPILTTTHGGYTLLLGNNPVFYREVVEAPWGTVWEQESLEAWQAKLHRQMREHEPPVLSEPAQDRWMYDRAWQHIAEHPILFLKSCWLRFRRFWNMAPLDAAADAVRGAWMRVCRLADQRDCDDTAETAVSVVIWGVWLFYLLVFAGMFLGLLRLTRSEWRQWMPLVLLLASFTVVHLLYWSNARMRAPLVPAIALLAARGVQTPRIRRERL